MDQETATIFAHIFMVIMTIVAGVGVAETRWKNSDHIWKEQPLICKMWIVVWLACFLPLFFKAFCLVVL